MQFLPFFLEQALLLPWYYSACVDGCEMHQPGLCCRIHSACLPAGIFQFILPEKQFHFTNHCSIVLSAAGFCALCLSAEAAVTLDYTDAGSAAVSVMFCVNLLCRRINWLRAVLSGQRPACAREMALLTRAPTLLISGMNLIWAEIIKAIMAAHWRR